jgi:hypothetical protein
MENRSLKNSVLLEKKIFIFSVFHIELNPS